MAKIIGIVISSIIFFLIFKFLGLTPKEYTSNECGFFYGLAHGFIAIPSLVVKLVTGKQALSAGNNSGIGYWLGYIVGFFFLGGLGFLGGRGRSNS